MPTISANQSLVDWFSETGTPVTPRVVTNLQPGASQSDGWQAVQVKSRVGTSTDLFGTTASPQLLDGPVTERNSIDTDVYLHGGVYSHFTSAAGSPNGGFRLSP